MIALTLLQVFIVRVASDGLPFPDFLFYPKDNVVGDVEQVGADELTARFKGKSALVVGGTDGIGRGTALQMAKAGADVSVAGHSKQKGEWMLGNLSQVALDPAAQQFHAYAQDLFTVKGCLNFTALLATTSRRFDYLVLTVGIWPDREEPKTTDGVDKVIALDVLARYLITHELLPLLNDGARVLSVLGSTAKEPPAPAVDVIKAIALGTKTDYDIVQMLGAAGVMGDTWMQVMPQFLGSTHATFMSTFPGIVGTDLVEHSNTFPAWFRPILEAGEKLMGMSAEESGLIHATIISSPNAAKRPTAYFNVNLEGRQTNPLAYDIDFGKWVHSFLEDTIAKHRRSMAYTSLV